jgi:hypothetical protein
MPPLFIVLSIESQESARSCICALLVSINFASFYGFCIRCWHFSNTFPGQGISPFTASRNRWKASSVGYPQLEPLTSGDYEYFLRKVLHYMDPIKYTGGEHMCSRRVRNSDLLLDDHCVNHSKSG